MKNMKWIALVSLLSASLVSCSKIGAGSTACNNAGYYAEQSECQNSVSSGVCTSTTVQTVDQNLVCWKSSTSSNQTGNTNTGTSTNTSTGCSSTQAPPWSMGAWTPSTCAVGVTQRTRVVSCNYSCPCAGAQPSTTETCTPNMFNGVHYESQCTAAGGTLEWIEGNRVCSFGGTPTTVNVMGQMVTVIGTASCPSGWTQFHYGNIPYTITTPASATEHTSCTGGRSTVYTGSHSTFSSARMKESRVYCSDRGCFGCKTWSTIYANVTRVACY